MKYFFPRASNYFFTNFDVLQTLWNSEELEIPANKRFANVKPSRVTSIFQQFFKQPHPRNEHNWKSMSFGLVLESPSVPNTF